MGVAEIRRVAVLGAGMWGTAFAKVLADAGCDVMIWARRGEIAAGIRAQRRNPEYLTEAVLPDRVGASSDPTVVLDGVDMVVLAMPSQTVRPNLGRWVAAGAIPTEATLVSLMKGIELG